MIPGKFPGPTPGDFLGRGVGLAKRGMGLKKWGVAIMALLKDYFHDLH